MGCARKAWHRIHAPDDYAEGGRFAEPDILTLRFTLGENIHRIVGGGTEESKTREWEGILYTPDEVDGEKRIVEFKSTSYSARKSIQDVPQYFDQLGAYCAFEGTTKGRLHIIFTRGRYGAKHPVTGEAQWDPELHTYDVEFSPVELAGWRRELQRRKALIENAPSLESIPLAEAWDWECRLCALKGEVCEGGKGERSGAFQHFVEMDEVKEVDDDPAA